jgi:hypothetical protein
VLYTFLLWQLVVDVTRSRDKPERQRKVEIGYIAISFAIYGWMAIWA